MATVAFNSTTIWNDGVTSGATRGVGRVNAVHTGQAVRWEMVPLRDAGKLAKNLGTEPGFIQLSLEYCISTSEWATLQTSLQGLRDDYGTLTWPPSKSESYCIMRGHTFTGRRAEVDNGTTKWRVYVVLQFERLRA